MERKRIHLKGAALNFVKEHNVDESKIHINFTLSDGKLRSNLMERAHASSLTNPHLYRYHHFVLGFVNFFIKNTSVLNDISCQLCNKRKIMMIRILVISRNNIEIKLHFYNVAT